MSTLLEAAQGVVDSANRLGTTNTMMLPYYLIEALEQAIAQEQHNKNAVPLDMVRFGGRCNIHPVNILPCTACEGMRQRKQASKDVAQLIGDLDAKIHKSFASQTASANPVVSQKTSGAVDKSCGVCKHERKCYATPTTYECTSCTRNGCVSYSDYKDNWEPKP